MLQSRQPNPELDAGMDHGLKRGSNGVRVQKHGSESSMRPPHCGVTKKEIGKITFQVKIHRYNYNRQPPADQSPCSLPAIPRKQLKWTLTRTTVILCSTTSRPIHLQALGFNVSVLKKRPSTALPSAPETAVLFTLVSTAAILVLLCECAHTHTHIHASTHRHTHAHVQKLSL